MPPLDNSGRAWSTIEATPLYMEKLQLLCHSQREVREQGYIVKPLTAAQIRKKGRCENCGGEVLPNNRLVMLTITARFKESWLKNKKTSSQRNILQHQQRKEAEKLLIDLDEPAVPLEAQSENPLPTSTEPQKLPGRGKGKAKGKTVERPVLTQPKSVCVFHPGGVANKVSLKRPGSIRLLTTVALRLLRPRLVITRMQRNDRTHFLRPRRPRPYAILDIPPHAAQVQQTCAW